jgi:O-antigen/teichoic acid export membrane protein
MPRMSVSGVGGTAHTDPAARRLRHRVSYNAVVRLGGRVAGALLALVALRLATRYFGPARWGLVVAASALANLFVGICDFGLLRIVSREIAADDADERSVYGAGLLAALAVSVVASGVMALACVFIFLKHPAIRSLALVLVLSIVPNALWAVSSAIFVGKARNDTRAIVDVASSLFLLGAAGATVAAALAASGYIWLTVLADAVTAVLSMGLARAYVRADFGSGRRQVARLLRLSAPLGLSQVLVSTYTQTEVVLLSLFVATGAVGEFGVAYQVALFGIAVPPMLTAAILPKFVDAPAERQLRLLQRSLDVLVATGAALPLFALVFARGVVLLVSGPKFIGATTPLVVLSCFAAITFPSAVFVDGLVYVRAERKVLQTTAIAMVANLVAAAAIIPFYGIDGAAVVMTGSALLVCVLAGAAFKRSATIWVSLRQPARYVAVAGVLTGAYWITHVVAGVHSSTGLAMIPEAAGLAVVYGLGVLAVGGRGLIGDGGGSDGTSPAT